MRRTLGVVSFVVLAGCGSATREPATPEPVATYEAPSATERACFSGTLDNGICQVFSAAREPLSAVAAHCQTTGGRWLETCPTEGRAGACTGEGQHAIYYGLGLGQDALRRGCEAEGHVFSP